MRILIVDDERRIRISLKVFLDQQPGWEVVGEACNSKEALIQCATLTPDVVLLDWGIPSMPSEDLIQQMVLLENTPAIIVFSGRIEIEGEALNAGASAFVGKTNPPDKLLDAIHKVINNQSRRTK